MAHPLLEKAAQHIAQARAINDEFAGKDMPAEAAHQMQAHLQKASDYRARVTREAQLADNEEWLAEPDYKHDLGPAGEKVAASFGHGGALLESERKELERKSFVDFVRKGTAGVRAEVKAALVEDSTGELIVPADYVGLIFTDLPRDAVLRSLAWVRPTSRNRVQLGSLNVASAGWGKLETTASPTINDGLGTPPLNPRDEVRVWNLYAKVVLGVDELEDTDENIEAIIRQQLALKIAEQEDDAFAGGTGDSAKMPFGITTGVTQKVTQATADTYLADEVKRLKYRVPGWARKNGVYLGKSEAEEAAALLKDGDGRYLFQPSASADEPPTLFGKRWYTVDGLPDAKPLVFGDPRQGYMIADRKRLTVQRLVETHAEEGKVALLFTHRVGGDVVRPKALAVYETVAGGGGD